MATQPQQTTTPANFDGGKHATHNPHPDFKSVEATRPPFDSTSQFHITKTVNPDWKFGDGANGIGRAAAGSNHLAIDPYESGRPAGFNYKLLISSIIPRPIAFVSTRSADGTSTNLAPFSYFNVVNHDPPLFVIGFAGGVEQPKDTLKNLLESKECVINIISEGFLEAANVTSMNSPFGVSEWDISGLTPVYDCRDVKCARVKEAVFSVEGKLDFFRESESRAVKGKKTGVMVVIEGTNFWVRKDAVNEDRNIVDPSVLRPVGRLGGIMYSRVTEAIEIPRPDFEKNLGGKDGYESLKARQ
ncbi:hypothetical protein HDV00_003911 [Rhizophlyctis rosea]|nr:hypothetical protein HDV00_003911 [Rhizophlyctis rosea]